MKLLIIGCNGQLGTDMLRVAENAGHTVGGKDFPEIDITDAAGTAKIIKQNAPSVIINCAAYTAVDDCEKNEPFAYRVNADGPGNLAKAAKETGSELVHISTDYVFDGTKRTPYLETDTPNPQSVYGKSKLEGELRITHAWDKHYIFRIAWLFGVHGANFVKTIRTVALKKSASGEPLKVVNDQFGTPTWTIDVCKQILKLIGTSRYGIYHATAEGMCSWYDFAREIVNAAAIPVTVLPCSTAEYPRPASRPSYSVLENERLKQSGLNIMQDWKDGFREFLEDEKRLKNQY